MITLSLIGIGTGNLDHVTLAAVRALNNADLILLPRKGEAKSDLIDLRRLLCERLLVVMMAAMAVMTTWARLTTGTLPSPTSGRSKSMNIFPTAGG